MASSPYDNSSVVPGMNSIHSRITYMPSMGYTGYGGFPTNSANCGIGSCHPSDVIYGAAAAAGVAPPRHIGQPPVAHSQTQSLTPVHMGADLDLSGMRSNDIQEHVSMRSNSESSLPEQLDRINGDGCKPLHGLSSLRLKARGHMTSPVAFE